MVTLVVMLEEVFVSLQLVVKTTSSHLCWIMKDAAGAKHEEWVGWTGAGVVVGGSCGGEEEVGENHRAQSDSERSGHLRWYLGSHCAGTLA